MLTVKQAQALEVGDYIVYDDGREGHQQVRAEVLSVTPRFLIAQFDDRAETTKVEFVPEWLNYLTEARRA